MIILFVPVQVLIMTKIVHVKSFKTYKKAHPVELIVMHGELRLDIIKVTMFN